MKDKTYTIYKKLYATYGEVDAELNYNGLYQLTIAVVLSAQTTDKQVNKVTPALFTRFPDFKSLGQANQADVELIIRSTGFYHSKSKNIIALGSAVSALNGNLPQTLEALIKLPGIGRKTANVVLSQGMGIPGLAVDTHVGRIARRTGMSYQKNPDKVELELKQKLAPKYWLKFHLLLIHHGRIICNSRKPHCNTCSIQEHCSYYLNNPDKP